MAERPGPTGRGSTDRAEKHATLRIREIYRSIQGESTLAGWPCTFVRTAGCDIRCGYCDEAHAFTGGERLETAEIPERVAELILAPFQP